MEKPDDNVEDIYKGFKAPIIMEYLGIRVKRLSDEQIDALYKRLLEFDEGNIIIPEIDK